MTSKKIKAAIRVAEAILTDEAIAAEAQITSRGLRKWKRDPEFAREIEHQQHIRRERIEAWRDRVLDLELADRSKRIARLEADLKSLDQIRAERAVHPDLSRLPGGKTGLVIMTGAKTIKYHRKDQHGRDVVQDQVLILHETDGALLSESRALMEQAARELGERVEKHELSGTGKNGEIVVKRVIGVPDSEI